MLSSGYKTCVVVNPFSGSGKMAKRWPEIEAKLKQAIGSFETVFTQYPAHATHLTRSAINGEFNRIIAVGGDGTLSQVINGFFSDDGHKTPLNPDAVLGFLGVGTGCDTARSLGIGNKLDEQIKTLINGRALPFDLGRVETSGVDGSTSVQLFINMCSFGISADIVSAVNKASLGKNISGRFAYLIGAFKALITNKNRKISLKINDGLEVKQTVALVGVANGAFCGGGVHLTPMALMNDAVLDAIVVGDVGFFDLVRYMRRLFKGKHMSHPKISHQPLEKLSAHVSGGEEHGLMPVEADGEFIGYLPCHIDVCPGAILVQVNLKS
ncbi:MAG: diacylglycerol kinase family lipid kinase [Sphingomonadales bacterium]|nr:diacylglycerol kinase family lipid kinase [Sphingomonadales bacterium]